MQPLNTSVAIWMESGSRNPHLEFSIRSLAVLFVDLFAPALDSLNDSIVLLLFLKPTHFHWRTHLDSKSER